MTLSVALWSKYPMGFLLEKIEPKLLERGIEVKKHLSIRTKDVDLSDIDCVLFMFELSSHAEINRLNILCKDKPRFPLSRKTSNWERDLKPLQATWSDNLPQSQNVARERQILLEQTLDEIQLDSAGFESPDSGTEGGGGDLAALETLYAEESEGLRTRIRELESENRALKELAFMIEQSMDEVRLKAKKKFEAFKDIVEFYSDKFRDGKPV